MASLLLLGVDEPDDDDSGLASLAEGGVLGVGFAFGPDQWQSMGRMAASCLACAADWIFMWMEAPEP